MSDPMQTSGLHADFRQLGPFSTEVEAMHAKWKEDWGWGTSPEEWGDPYSSDNLMRRILEMVYGND